MSMGWGMALGSATSNEPMSSYFTFEFSVFGLFGFDHIFDVGLVGSFS